LKILLHKRTFKVHGAG